jgi:hypothetical protein
MRGMGLVDQRSGNSSTLPPSTYNFSHRVFWAVVRFNEARRGAHAEEELLRKTTDISARSSVETSPRYVMSETQSLRPTIDGADSSEIVEH